MPGKNYNAARRLLANDLRKLEMVLCRLGVCSDTSQLSKAATQCQEARPNGDSSWCYSLSNMTFDVAKPSGLMPSNIDAVSIALTADVAGDFECSDHDPFTTLAINIEKIGYRNGTIKHRGAWHFDRHQYDDGDGEPTELHPLYHVQHGGKNLIENITHYGETLTMSAPRVMHPPLDAILAIDFILSNFSSTRWDAIKSDSQYRNIVIPAYDKFWRPYFNALHNYFSTSTATHDDGIGLLYPLEL